MPDGNVIKTLWSKWLWWSSKPKPKLKLHLDESNENRNEFQRYVVHLTVFFKGKMHFPWNEIRILLMTKIKYETFALVSTFDWTHRKCHDSSLLNDALKSWISHWNWDNRCFCAACRGNGGSQCRDRTVRNVSMSILYLNPRNVMHRMHCIRNVL